MDEQTRLKLNRERLELLHPTIRTKVKAVLMDMQGHQLRPVLASSTFRSPAEQLKLYNTGRSKVKWGFHCAVSPTGKPESLAADIIDADLGWNASQRFWLMLGSSAMAHGMTWGGLWGLPDSIERGLLKAISDKVWDKPVKLGWDVAHIETKRVTIAEAKAGKR